MIDLINEVQKKEDYNVDDLMDLVEEKDKNAKLIIPDGIRF